jgi:hypothetical protein
MTTVMTLLNILHTFDPLHLNIIYRRIIAVEAALKSQSYKFVFTYQWFIRSKLGVLTISNQLSLHTYNAVPFSFARNTHL